jgi:hypothetical protein
MTNGVRHEFDVCFQDPGGKPRRLQPERVSAEKGKFFYLDSP